MARPGAINASASFGDTAAAPLSSANYTLQLLAEMGLTNSSAADNLTICQKNTFYHPYDGYDTILLGPIQLAVICCGLLANVISVTIFTHRSMRQAPINWYLAVLSSTDFVILCSSFLMLTLPRMGQILGVYSLVKFSYNMTQFAYAIGVMSQTISVYMTVAVSAHRYIGVCYPFKAVAILTKTRVKSAIILVILFGVLFNATRYFEVQVVAHCPAENINESMPILSQTPMRLAEVYKLVFMGWAYTILMFIVPFVALIVMNTRVILAVHRTTKLHGAMAGGDDLAKRQEMAKEVSTSVMLVGIVLVFLGCNSLGFIVNILENLMDAHPNLYPTYSNLVVVSNLLVNVNASINILVYTVFSERYRILLKYFLGCDWMREGHMLIPITESFHA